MTRSGATRSPRFEALPFAHDTVRLRRWDDLAKTPGRETSGLPYDLAVLDELRVPGRPMQDAAFCLPA